MGRGKVRTLDDEAAHDFEKAVKSVGARISIPDTKCRKPYYLNVETFRYNGNVILDYIDVKFFLFGKTRRFRPVVFHCGEDEGAGLLVEMRAIQTDLDFFAQEVADRERE